MKRLAAVVGVVAACSGGKSKQKETPHDAGATAPPAPSAPSAPPTAATLPPAPPLPAVPLGLPPAELEETVTPDNVALGELLFFDKRIGREGKGACADCHEADHGWSDRQVRSSTLAGKPNLRHAPALVNLAWVPAFGWDGRFAALPDAVRAHWKGQLDVEPVDAVAAIAADPTYRAQFARAAQSEPNAEAAITALAAFVATRYEGDSPWDQLERGGGGAPDARDAGAGYKLFTGKAQCSTCHVPPLYTDHDYHRIGLIQSQDEGRGRVDPGQAGAFRTPTLRGAARRGPFFHDGSAATLAAAIQWHLDGGTGQGAGPDAIDPALVKVTLTADEQRQLLAFVEALTAPRPAPAPPVLP